MYLPSAVAVKVFKAAVTLERIRRENDEKVITLNLAMCDMMDILTGCVPIRLSVSTCSGSQTCAV